MSISKEDITWLVIVDGEILHETETKDDALEWAEKKDITPDRVASKVPLDGYIRL